MEDANVTVIPKVNHPKSVECDHRLISFIPTITKLLEAKIGNCILDAISEKKLMLNNSEKSKKDYLFKHLST